MTQTEMNFTPTKKPAKAKPEKHPVECDDCKWKGEFKQIKDDRCPKCKSNNWWEVDKMVRKKRK